MKRIISLLCLLAILFSTGCNLLASLKPSPTPEPSATQTNTPSPTFTPTPTNTPTLIPSPTPTEGPPRITSENFMDHLDEIQEHIYGYYGISEFEKINITTITEKEYKELLKTQYPLMGRANNLMRTIILNFFSLVPRGYDYSTYDKGRQKSDVDFFAGTNIDLETRSISFVEGFSEPDMQLFSYINRVVDFVFYDQLTPDTDTTNLLMAYTTYDGNNVVTAIGMGTTYYIIDKWLQDYGDPEAEIPEGFLRRTKFMPGEIPPYLEAREHIPIDYGKAFVEHIANTEGFPAMLNILLNPPQASSLIVHPERYPHLIKGNIEIVDFTENMPGEWEVLYVEIMGELFLYQWLTQLQPPSMAVEESLAREISSGWSTDYLLIYGNPETSEVVLSYSVMFSDPEKFESLGNELERIIGYMKSQHLFSAYFAQRNYTYQIMISLNLDTYKNAVDAYNTTIANP